MFWASDSTIVPVVPPGARDERWYMTTGASAVPPTTPMAQTRAELPSTGQLPNALLARTVITPSSRTLAAISSASGADGLTPDEER